VIPPAFIKIREPVSESYFHKFEKNTQEKAEPPVSNINYYFIYE